MTLDKLPIGKKAVIVGVEGEEKLRYRLSELGFTPHTEIELRKVAPLGDPMELRLRGYTLTLRRDDAAMIEVRL